MTETVEAKHTPGPLAIVERGAGQFSVESDWLRRDGDWREIYVSFSGFFGSHGPQVFATAPDVLDAAKALLACDTAANWNALREAVATAEGRA